MAESKSAPFVAWGMKEIAKERIVLDVGGGTRFGKWLREYEPLFADCDYRTFDFDTTTGADVIGDIHAIPLPDGSIDGIICSSVLEHVKNPIRAVEEMYRILRPGGKMFLFVPSTYPYHAHKGHYPDYWRIFDDTLEMLLSDFSDVTTHKRGGYFLAISFFVPFQHKLRWVLTPVAEMLDTLFKTENKNTTAGYFALAVK